MKQRLWCRIFGHTFLTRRTLPPINNAFEYMVETKPSDWCVKCGWTKEEIKESEAVEGK